MKRKENVKFTIVITVLNMKETIERAILSVLNQSYLNRELIVMDGGSTDGTIDVIRKYIDKLSYWSSEPDDGPSDAIAKALPHANGRLIGFLGADDWYEPYALELVARSYEEQEGDIYYGNMLVHDHDTERLIDLSCFDQKKLFTDGTQWLGAVCSYVKKELLEENYKKNNNFLLTDFLFFMRLYADDRVFVHISSDKPITNFTIGGRTTTQRYRVVRDSQKVREQFLMEYPIMRQLYKSEIEDIERAYLNGRMEFYMEILGEKRLGHIYKEVLDISFSECYLFGGGRYAKRCIRLFKGMDIRINRIFDNDDKMWGTKLDGIEIYNPVHIKVLKGKIIIISAGKMIKDEIYKQLCGWGVTDENTIIFAFDLFSSLAAKKIDERIGGVTYLDEAYKKGLIL